MNSKFSESSNSFSNSFVFMTKLPISLPEGFPGDSDGKESACNAGDLGSILGLGRSPGGGQDNPLQYSYLENPHGQRSLAGYSPWCHRELDMTKRLSKAQQGYSLHSLSNALMPVHDSTGA